MPYGIMRTSKAKGKGNISAIQRHNKADHETIKKLAEKDEDIRLENLNYNYTIINCEDFNKEIEDTIKTRLTKEPRKDAVKLLDAVVTYSPEKTPDLICLLHQKDKKWQEANKEMWEDFLKLDKETRLAKANEEYNWMKNYFKESVEFYQRHYGVVISAEVHMHETTPHIHINTIPLVKGNEGNWKLNAKEIMGNKAKLSQMQTCFYEEVAKDYGLDRGRIRQPKEAKKHLSKTQKQLEDATKQLEEVTRQRDVIQIQLNNLKDDYEELKKDYANILSTYSDLTDRISELSDKLRNISSTLTTETQLAIKGHTKKANEALTRVEQLIKDGKMPKTIFGKLNEASHEVKQAEDLVEEEERER
jgi:archaellum component FlaC